MQELSSPRPRPEPRLFSFNNPFGACPRCLGFGNRPVDRGALHPEPVLVRLQPLSRLFRLPVPSSLALPAALAMCGFLGSSQVVLYDIALLSESLYSSAIIVAVALLFLALRDSRPILLFASLGHNGLLHPCKARRPVLRGDLCRGLGVSHLNSSCRRHGFICWLMS